MHEIRSPRRYRKPKCARCEIDSAGFEGFEIRRRRPSNPPDYFLLSSETIRTPLSYSRIAYSVIALNHPIIRGFPRCRYRAPPPFSTLAPRKGPVSKSLRLLSLFQASNRNNVVFDRKWIDRVANRKVEECKERCNLCYVLPFLFEIRGDRGRRRFVGSIHLHR